MRRPGTPGRVTPAITDPVWYNLFTMYGTATHGSSSSGENSLLDGSSVGTLSFAAHSIQAGTVVRLRASGLYTSVGVTCTLRVYWNASGTGGAAADCMEIALPGTGTNTKWSLEAYLICTGLGETNNVRAKGFFFLDGDATYDPEFPMTVDDTGDLPVTSATVLNLTQQFGTGVPGQSVSVEFCVIDVAGRAF